MDLLPIVSGLIGLAIALLLIPLTLRQCARRPAWVRAHDSHHTSRQPMPRFGGLAFVAAFIVVELFTALVRPEQRAHTPARNVILLSSLAIFALGFWDDLRPLGARKKLLGQVLISLLICWSGLGVQDLSVPFIHGGVSLHGWGTLLTVLWLVGMTNLINLIDGADGLAAGICLMLMVLIAYVSHGVGQFELLASGMVGALLGFLWFNFPPARIYLGDGGAYFLGFQIGVFSLANSHKGDVFAALAAPMFALALPILDTGLAILRRGLSGLPIFRPDRKHLHHRLRAIGFSHRKVVLSFYAVTLVFLLLGFAAVWSRGQWVPELLGLGALVLLACAGSLSFSRRWFDIGRVVGGSLERRREVRYALTLTRWLELGGGRQTRFNDLWLDLVAAAQKLGFASVKLTLPDGQHSWPAAAAPQPLPVLRREFDGGGSGILELTAPLCELNDTERRVLCPRSSRPPHCPCVSDAQLFELLSELLAEGWLKAVNRWKRAAQLPVRFDAQARPPRPPPRQAAVPGRIADIPVRPPSAREPGQEGKIAQEAKPRLEANPAADPHDTCGDVRFSQPPKDLGHVDNGGPKS